ncbi:WD40-repeat-containing domain protein [Mycena olivaceomarginata]|nr:WD40-repeat-containing domain protein [Mycena olivaceomarginata]
MQPYGFGVSKAAKKKSVWTANSRSFRCRSHRMEPPSPPAWQCTVLCSYGTSPNKSVLAKFYVLTTSYVAITARLGGSPQCSPLTLPKLPSRAGTRQVLIWNIGASVDETTLDHGPYAASVAFSPDGCLVASGCSKGSIRIWEASSGSLLGELDKHTMEVRSVVFSADGRRLFSASDDATIRVWSLFDGSLPTLAPPSRHKPSSSSRQQQNHEKGHSESVLSVVFSPTSDGWFRLPARVRLQATRKSLYGIQNRESVLLS